MTTIKATVKESLKEKEQSCTDCTCNDLKITDDNYIKKTIETLITILKTRENKQNYTFSIAKLKGCIEKMPED